MEVATVRDVETLDTSEDVDTGAWVCSKKEEEEEGGVMVVEST